MIKAVFKQGTVQLLQPPPAEWEDGQDLNVTPGGNGVHSEEWEGLPEPDNLYEANLTPQEIDELFDKLDEMCSHSDPADDELMMQAIAKQRAEQKELKRKQMGL